MAEEEHLDSVEFFFGQYVGLRASLESLVDDAAAHLEEHGALEDVVEVFTAHHLSVLEQLDAVAVLQGVDYGLSKFGRAGTHEGDFGNDAADVQRHFGSHVDVVGAIFAAGEERGILALEVEHNIHVGTLAHDAEVEDALHGGLHAVNDFAGSDLADAYLFGHEFGHPATGTADEGFVADAPREVTAGADGQAGIAYAVSLLYKKLYLFRSNHKFEVWRFRGFRLSGRSYTSVYPLGL